MLERLAEWYLERRGRTVLSSTFIGMAIGGYAQAIKIGDDGSYDCYRVMILKCGDVLVLNHSMLDVKPPINREFYMGQAVDYKGHSRRPK